MEASRPLSGTVFLCVERCVLRGGEVGASGERTFPTSDFRLLVLKYIEVFFIP